MTHYQTLGVPESASAAAVRAAYRAIARVHHPDVNRRPDAESRFAAAASAYEVLGDEQKRREYDRALAVERARAAAAHTGRAARDTGQGHYSWTNIAAAGARAAQEESEFDELYETFFAPRVRAMRAARQSEPVPAKPKRAPSKSKTKPRVKSPRA